MSARGSTKGKGFPLTEWVRLALSHYKLSREAIRQRRWVSLARVGRTQLGYGVNEPYDVRVGAF